MEETWSISGVCGTWSCTVSVIPQPDTTHPFDPVAAEDALDALRRHFLATANLLEVRALWEAR